MTPRRLIHGFAVLLTLALAAQLGSLPAAADHLSSRYAAIAYSQSTGKYGYAYGFRSRCAAECEALRRCPADDARIVVWTRNNWCALAVGDDRAGYGYAWNGCATRAKCEALRRCRERTTGCYIAACVYSG